MAPDSVDLHDGDVRVIVCGAGIGGLTLAQALRDRCEVTVIERDGSAVETGGYRLAINGAATAVLSRVLPPDLLGDLRAVSDGVERFAQFTIATRSLRPVVIGREDTAEDRLLAQRRAVRLLLTRGLDDRIRWSTRVAAVREHRTHATVTLADGTCLEADLVVGAEGASSPTVRAASPGTAPVDLGLTGIAGSVVRRGGDPVPRYLLRGPALAFAPDGVGVFLSLTSADGAVASTELRDAVGEPSLVWGLIAPSQLVPGATRQPPNDLVTSAVTALRGWPAWLTDRIHRSELDRVAAFAFRAADPRADFTPWRPGRLTALGDAIHAMPPTGGQAASTAIRDAGSLSAAILDHLDGKLPLPDALARYHAELETWARPALRESLGPVRIIRALRHPVARAIAYPLSAAVDLLPAYGV